MPNSVKKLLSGNNVDVASSVLRAFAHPLRLKILSFINENDRINVNRIYSKLNLEQSITSQHLRILRDAGLVLSIRDGKFILYSLNYGKIEAIADALQGFMGH